MDAFCHNDMRVDSSDKNWAPTQNHWYAISLLNFDLWIDKPLLQACLRSLVSYERCTNCSSIHKTIVLSMCALVKRATSDAMSFQALRTWCFIRDEKMDEKLAGAYSAWSVYKYIQIYILAKEHVHKSHSYIYCYIDVFVKQHTVHSDNRYSLSLWALLHVYFESLGAQNLALEGNQGLQHCFFWITLF